MWIYRRDPRINRLMSAAVRRSVEGLPYIAPEIQLLFKSKAPRTRDEIDFVQIAPLLAPDARAWLFDAIRLVNPQHNWLSTLKDR